jgi:hypothetical protein
MKNLVLRLCAVVATLAAVAVLSAAASKSARKGHVAEPDKLIVLSTTDVKGKTSPCG